MCKYFIDFLTFQAQNYKTIINIQSVFGIM